MTKLEILQKILAEKEEQLLRHEIDMPFDSSRAEILAATMPKASQEYKALFLMKSAQTKELLLYIAYIKKEIQKESGHN